MRVPAGHTPAGYTVTAPGEHPQDAVIRVSPHAALLILCLTCSFCGFSTFGDSHAFNFADGCYHQMTDDNEVTVGFHKRWRDSPQLWS
jgi:hypothetical protein